MLRTVHDGRTPGRDGSQIGTAGAGCIVPKSGGVGHSITASSEVLSGEVKNFKLTATIFKELAVFIRAPSVLNTP